MLLEDKTEGNALSELNMQTKALNIYTILINVIINGMFDGVSAMHTKEIEY